jgi:beta-lactam-binding protein with PASTA domain
MRIGEATARLEHLGIRVTTKQTYSRAARRTVLSERPPPGTLLADADVVVLTLPKPYPEIPDIVGETLDGAMTSLRSRGFTSAGVRRIGSSANPGTVLRTLPHVGKSVLPSVRLAIYVAKPQPVPPTCDPNYEGACVPIVSYDLDCIDIGYQTVYVVGYDKYGFDGYDNDGVGCE